MNLLRWISIPVLFIISPMFVELVFNLLHDFIVNRLERDPDSFLPIMLTRSGLMGLSAVFLGSIFVTREYKKTVMNCLITIVTLGFVGYSIWMWLYKPTDLYEYIIYANIAAIFGAVAAKEI
ncbi:hypothetical protein Q7458_07280 [Glaesserella parasuis]|uniref:hypothetical protein n=1 Tax=Glaesserella parasuis TaxID=738 RepID=UPI0013DEF747|nr:hypothetical protein [Glaesserella parasuis]MDO9799167.1 hypothetical protein [Glaesserella parasuis]MDO9851229.1 hypothetical protein [Glaesserella parasuis]MDO9865287.1 hypothetical protein [Glaesserella parasuis]MDO9882436.1 hypothetical protein [Glaesserella parasuis]MDO9884937.1 hypothetical protein [Glaesserella parasuis]